MSSAPPKLRVNPASLSARDARTLAAFMALANDDLAKRLRDLRSQQGNPPQKVVAAAMGVGHRTYQTWESAEARPNYNGVKRLAAYYGVTMEYILEGIESEAAPEPQSQLDRIEAMLAEILNRLDDGAGLAAGSADEPSLGLPPGPPASPQAPRTRRAS